MVLSETAGDMVRIPFNPIGTLILLDKLISKGSTFRTNLVLIILSITAASINNATMYQQKSNRVKGNNGTICHEFSMMVICPSSKSGNNIAIILFGAGCCERLLDGDISLRDIGGLSE